jgi:hypothetical protein
MPSKKNNKRGPAGNPGLVGTADQNQSSDQAMSTEVSSGPAGELPQQGLHIDAGLAAINALDDLFDTTAEKAVKDSDIQDPDTKKKVSKKMTNSFSLNPKTSFPEPPRTSQKI